LTASDELPMNKTLRTSFASLIMYDLRIGGFETVGQLWERFHSQNPKTNSNYFRVQLGELMRNGHVEIVETPLINFDDFLRSWRYGFRLWALLIATLAALPIVEFMQAGFPLIVIRWTAATFLLLFAPGFAFVWVLFPSRQRMSGFNRLGLTIAMSLFLVPAIGLVFHFTPLGIEPQPVAAALAALTVTFLLLGAYREYVIQTRRQEQLSPMMFVWP